MLSAVIPSVLGYPALPLAGQLVHQWHVQPGPLVLVSALLSLPTPTADRDRTVSRRSEPSSRTALNGEQPYPWDLLQPQDAMSRHRGAKPPRRCELSGEGSSEIVVEVKIPPTRGKTERPRGPLLQLGIVGGISMCRIGGRLRSLSASSGGAVLEIPPLDILPTNPHE